MPDEISMARRVTLIEQPRAESINVTNSADGGTNADCGPLLDLLEDVAHSVRAGRYAANDHDGVLVDTVVGGFRCLLLVHEPSLLVRLSPREQEVARMVADGRTNQAIADCLEISIWTVSTHLRRIFAKLAVSSRAEMVARLLAQWDFSHLIGPGRASIS